MKAGTSKNSLPHLKFNIMKQLINTLFFLLLTSAVSACMIDQLVGETNNGVNWPEAGPTWGQSFVACEDGDVWEIAIWPHLVTTGIHTLILTDINCVTMWTVNNINLSTSGGNPVTVDLATGSGTSRFVTSGSSYIFQLIGPANSNLQMWLTFSEPYPAGEDKAANCGTYGLDWWFRLSIDEPLSSLPIELINFSGILDENNYVQLIWSTSSEVNNSGFEIEHSTNGLAWKGIKFVEGRGNSLGINEYSYTDDLAVPGKNYYRLKQIDFDGQFDYSYIVHIFVKRDELSYKVSPNPVQNDIHIIFDTPTSNNLMVNLFSIRGEILYSEIWSKDLSERTISDMNLSPGIYFIEISEKGKQSKLEKIIKY
jgi:hypothetical protein